MNSILIVEDDQMLNAGICYNLEGEGFSAVPVYDCKTAREKIENGKWDLIILDGNLPDGTGFNLCKNIRMKSKTPIIFLTACDMDDDMLRGFECGADDYITKPFNIKIFLQRVKAILRRCEEESSKTFFCGKLELDFDKRIAKKSGETLILTPTEFKLLQIFSRNLDKVLTRRTLLEKLWDNEGDFVDEHTLTIHISRLRGKIEDDRYQYIKTVYGMGYQWMGDHIEKNNV